MGASGFSRIRIKWRHGRRDRTTTAVDDFRRTLGHNELTRGFIFHDAFDFIVYAAWQSGFMLIQS